MLRYCGTKRVGREAERERERRKEEEEEEKKISKSCESREFDAKVSRGSPRFSLLRICVPPLHTWRGFPWNGGKKKEEEEEKKTERKKTTTGQVEQALDTPREAPVLVDSL